MATDINRAERPCFEGLGVKRSGYGRWALGVALTAGTVLAATAAVGQVTESFNASVQIASNFTVTEVTPINFGILAINPGGTMDGTATVALAPDGSGTLLGGDGWISVQEGTPGQLQITGAAPNAAITTTVTAGQLTNFANADEIQVDSVDFDIPQTTDAAGDLTLNYGAVLTPQDTDTSSTFEFVDGVYSGTFSIQFSY
ncbi:MAG: DUF4402 domain-containing protein [Alphaproteobacteria bacterium]